MSVWDDNTTFLTVKMKIKHIGASEGNMIEKIPSLSLVLKKCKLAWIVCTRQYSEQMIEDGAGAAR